MIKEIKAGDIWSSQWGCDQTNVDFFVVRSVTAATVTLQKVESVRTLKSPTAMQGTTVPDTSRTLDKPFRRKIHTTTYDGRNFVMRTNYALVSPWSGRPEHYSTDA